MATDDSTSLVPLPISNELEKSINSLSEPLAGYLSSLGLPTENILAPIDERKKVIDQLENALAELPMEERERSYYLTKFTVAIAIGLFDGALSYLWNETIIALRRMVANFDLAYFFSVAEKISSRNRNFGSVEDLDQVQDHDLLEACRRIGFISDVNYRRLENVDFMRNHASAAHPNEIEIDGYEMLAYLSNCLRYAIVAKPNQSVISINRLLGNIRTTVIPEADFTVIGSEIEKLSQERIDDLLWTLFGLYVDSRQTADTKSNIGNLAGFAWTPSSEDRRYEIGAKYGIFRKNADVRQTEAAEAFLQLVDGQRYKDDDSLAGELLEKLDTLKSVHFGMNNFYSEHPHAKVLGQSLPINGIVPRAARPGWVKVVCICYIGNGHGYLQGVDEAALPYYADYVNSFGEAEIVEFLHLMGDAEVNSAFSRKKADARVRELAGILKSKSDNIHIKKALDLIMAAPAGKLDVIFGITDYKTALKFVPNHK